LGDPASNKLIGQIAGKLPMKWDGASVAIGKKFFPADHHAAVLVYPNPLNPAKYVVLNSGFTFREYDYLNNARQVAKLPDYAVVDLDVPVTSRAQAELLTQDFLANGGKFATKSNSRRSLEENVA